MVEGSGKYLAPQSIGPSRSLHSLRLENVTVRNQIVFEEGQGYQLDGDI